jgi:hypothetical protein
MFRSILTVRCDVALGHAQTQLPGIAWTTYGQTPKGSRGERQRFADFKGPPLHLPPRATLLRPLVVTALLAAKLKKAAKPSEGHHSSADGAPFRLTRTDFPFCSPANPSHFIPCYTRTVWQMHSQQLCSMLIPTT